MDPKELPPTLTVEQAGALLGISRSAAYQAVATGELPALRIGRRWIVPTAPLVMLGLQPSPTGQAA